MCAVYSTVYSREGDWGGGNRAYYVAFVVWLAIIIIIIHGWIDAVEWRTAHATQYCAVATLCSLAVVRTDSATAHYNSMHFI